MAKIIISNAIIFIFMIALVMGFGAILGSGDTLVGITIIVSILGLSGCGEITFLRIIAGFNSIEGGEIYFEDKVIDDIPAHKINIGMVFQNYAIFPHSTIR